MHENFITHSISEWYINNERTLPWRENPSPYRIWLSEIILQQTRVDQGLDYYRRFIIAFPSVESLANASLDEVLKLWQGLGYYSRARNLHYTAQDIVNNYKGKFPQSYEGLLSLKGVGEYTAAAIASIAYHQPVAVVDGNVFRVLTRLFGIETPIDKAITKRAVKELADELLDKRNPGTFNQAMMEFGALMCTPKSPDCSNCPVKIDCYAFNNQLIEKIPVKTPKKKQRKRYFYYLVYITPHNSTYLTNRNAGDIWTGLWEFPLLEKNQEVESTAVIQQAIDAGIVSGVISFASPVKTYKHILSHQIIYGSFLMITGKSELQCTDCKEIPISELEKYPVSRLTERFLEEGFDPHQGS